MITVKEIAEANKISRAVLYARIKALKIVPTKVGGRLLYSRSNILEMLTMKKIVNISVKRKIMIIEYWLLFKSQPLKITAIELNISYNHLIKLISEYKKNDNSIIIESKL